jgi:hypothetical protein
MKSRQTFNVITNLAFYNFIVLVISVLFMFLLISRFDIRNLLLLLIPGSIFTSSAILIQKRLRGKVTKDGIIGIVMWMLLTMLFLIGLVFLLSRYSP